MGVHQDSDGVYSRIKELLDIPQDEPIFILRGQDKFAVDMLRDYRKRVRDGIRGQKPKGYVSWTADMAKIIERFSTWRRNNKDRVKVPD